MSTTPRDKHQGISESDEAWDRRVCAYEALGMTRSDAQGVVEAEEMQHGPAWIFSAPLPAASPLTEKWVGRYAEEGCDAGCPKCKGSLTGGPITIEGDQATQEISCAECSYSFFAVYGFKCVVPSNDEDNNGEAIYPQNE